MGFFDRLKIALMRRGTEAVIQHLHRQMTDGNLRITRRPSVPEDAVTPERLSAITYDFSEITPTPLGAGVRSMKYNPDRGTELEPDAMAAQAGEVTDTGLKQRILAGLTSETVRALAGADPDVEFGVPTKLETPGERTLGPVYRSTWTKKTDRTPGR